MDESELRDRIGKSGFKYTSTRLMVGGMFAFVIGYATYYNADAGSGREGIGALIAIAGGACVLVGMIAVAVRIGGRER